MPIELQAQHEKRRITNRELEECTRTLDEQENGKINILFCRKVLIFFNSELQETVLQLFCESIYSGGFLCLRSKESLRFAKVVQKFEAATPGKKIYRKERT